MNSCVDPDLDGEDSDDEPEDSWWSRWKVPAILGGVATLAVIGLLLWGGVVDRWAGKAVKRSDCGQALAPKCTETTGEVRDYSVPGTYGDAFAPLTGLFTSLALGAAIASVFMQREELQSQRQEMRLARKQYRAQARALRDANKLAERANELAHSAQLADVLRQITDINNLGVAAFQESTDRYAKIKGAMLLESRDFAGLWFDFAQAEDVKRRSDFVPYYSLQLHELARQRERLEKARDQLRGDVVEPGEDKAPA